MQASVNCLHTNGHTDKKMDNPNTRYTQISKAHGIKRPAVDTRWLDFVSFGSLLRQIDQ